LILQIYKRKQCRITAYGLRKIVANKNLKSWFLKYVRYQKLAYSNLPLLSVECNKHLSIHLQEKEPKCAFVSSKYELLLPYYMLQTLAVKRG